MRAGIIFPAFFLLWSLIAASYGVAGTPTKNVYTVAPDYDRLVQLAQQRNKVRVIVNYDETHATAGTRLNKFLQVRARLLSRLKQYNISPLREFTGFKGGVYSLSTTELDELINSAEVASVFEDKLNSPHLVQSRVLIGATVSNSYGLDGSGTVVAVIDTGIEASHPAFTGRVVQEACFSTNYSSYNSVNLCPSGSSAPDRQITQFGAGAAAVTKCTDGGVDCSHGTHVASIIGSSDSTYKGVAPAAQIVAIQAFSLFSSETECGVGKAPCVRSYDSDIISALEYVADLSGTHNLAAVNMSLGGGKYTTDCDADTPYTSAVTALDSLGIAVVASSGNNSYKDGLNAPACISAVFSVGSVHDTTDLVSSWSNAAPDFLDILAPGQGGIRAAIPGGGYAGKSGTSMASPHVAAAFALLKQYDGGLSVNGMKSLMTTHSTAVTDTRTTPAQVYPRLDLGRVTQFLAGPAEVPTLSINSPLNAAIINLDTMPVQLVAVANDPQDGDISSAVTWTSEIDGVVGSLATLSLGTSMLTAEVSDSTGFTVEESIVVNVVNGPAVTIDNPMEGSELLQGSAVTLSASAVDIEDGDLSSSVEWQSTIDGSLGSGSALPVMLSAGVHIITASVVDSDGAVPSLAPSIQLTVLADVDADGMADSWETFYGLSSPVADPDSDGLTNLEEYNAASNPIDAAPTLLILSPLDGSLYKDTDLINLVAQANDTEDGDLSAEVIWSAALSGALGNGSPLEVSFAVGDYAISATVMDSQGASIQNLTLVAITVASPGDVNVDGRVDITDLMLIQHHMLGLDTLTEGQQRLADVYPIDVGDGQLTLADVLILSQWLVVGD